MTEVITPTARLRRLALVVVAGAALFAGLLAGVHKVAYADPCPCTLPACKTVCRQN